MKCQRWARGWLGSRHSHDGIFAAQTAAFARARVLVGCYYVAVLYFALVLMPDWPAIVGRSAPAALWPVSWLHLVNLRCGVAAILGLNLAGALAAAVVPQRRWARVAAFLGMFELVALNNSYGKIGHSMHAWVITSGLMIFLPEVSAERNASRTTRQQFLVIFWACQVLVLLLYTMAGVGKLGGAVYQLCAGQTSAFSPGAMAYITANRLIETNSHSVIGPWLIDHPLAGWPLLWANIYLQFFSFWAAFRPSLHRIWALALILFHLAAYLLLTISFSQNALLLALLFFNSPFVSSSLNWRDMLADLPLFGTLLTRMFPRSCAS